MKAILILLSIAFALACAGCGGGGGGGTGTQDPTPSPSITLDKTDITLHPGESATVTATASGGLDGTDLVWGSNPTILAQMVTSSERSSVCQITASPSLGQWEATVRSQTNWSLAATVHVNVIEADPVTPPPPAQQIRLSPTALSVVVGQQFTVYATASNGLSLNDVAWEADPHFDLVSVTIDNDQRTFRALPTSGNDPGPYLIRVYNRNDPSKSAYSSVSINSPQSPPSPTMALSIYSLQVDATRSFQIIANISQGDGSDIVWTSDYDRMTVSTVGTGPGYSVCRVDSILSAYGVHHVTARSRSHPTVSASCTVDFGLN